MIVVNAVAILSVMAFAVAFDMDYAMVPQSCIDEKNTLKQCCEQATRDSGINFTGDDIVQCFDQEDSNELPENEDMPELLKQFKGVSNMLAKKACMVEKLSEPMNSCVRDKVTLQLASATELNDEKEEFKKVMKYFFKAVGPKLPQLLPGAMMHEGKGKPGKGHKFEIARPIRFELNTSAGDNEIPAIAAENEQALADFVQPSEEITNELDMSIGEKLKNIRNTLSNINPDKVLNMAKDYLSGANKSFQHLKGQALRSKRGAMMPNIGQLKSLIGDLPEGETKSCLEGLFADVTDKKVKDAMCASKKCMPNDFKATQCYQDTQALAIAACECHNELVDSGTVDSAMSECAIDRNDRNKRKNCEALENKLSNGFGRMQQMVDKHIDNMECDA